MKTCIYARQSIDKNNSISIDTQIDICKRYIKEGDQFEISAYTDDYDQTICIVLPVNK